MAIKKINIAIQGEKLSEKVVPVKFCKRENSRASFLQSINAFILMVALTVLENKRVEIVSTVIARRHICCLWKSASFAARRKRGNFWRRDNNFNCVLFENTNKQ